MDPSGAELADLVTETATGAYEQPLATFLREQLAGMPGVKLYGPPETVARPIW